MRTETKYNKIVNFDEETKEITVLDYIFYDTLHGKPFNGSVGTIFEIVSKDDVMDTIEPSNVLNYLADIGGKLNCQFSDIDEDGFIDMMYDTSYRELWDYLRKALKLNKDEAYIFNCSGGGRCFDKDFQGNVNTKLSNLIRKSEC